MTDEDIRVRVAKVFCDVFDQADLVITNEMTAEDVEEWDSISHINLVLAIERAFHITFTTREVAGLANVGDLIQLVIRKSGS